MNADDIPELVLKLNHFLGDLRGEELVEVVSKCTDIDSLIEQLISVRNEYLDSQSTTAPVVHRSSEELKIAWKSVDDDISRMGELPMRLGDEMADRYNRALRESFRNIDMTPEGCSYSSARQDYEKFKLQVGVND